MGPAVVCRSTETQAEGQENCGLDFRTSAANPMTLHTTLESFNFLFCKVAIMQALVLQRLNEGWVRAMP